MKRRVCLITICALLLMLCGCEEQKLAYPNSKTIVTASEYEKLASGMSLEEVKKIVGGDCIKTSEVEISNSKQVIYTCNAKGEDEATVTLTFFEDKLFAKNQIGLK